MPALFVRVHSTRVSYRVELVDKNGTLAKVIYDGRSQTAKFCAISYLRKIGYCEGYDSGLVSTSGGSGVKVGLYEREHIAALRGGKG